MPNRLHEIAKHIGGRDTDRSLMSIREFSEVLPVEMQTLEGRLQELSKRIKAIGVCTSTKRGKSCVASRRHRSRWCPACRIVAAAARQAQTRKGGKGKL